MSYKQRLCGLSQYHDTSLKYQYIQIICINSTNFVLTIIHGISMVHFDKQCEKKWLLFLKELKASGYIKDQRNINCQNIKTVKYQRSSSWLAHHPINCFDF